MLTDIEKKHYSRHFPVIGEAGQHRLRQSKVLCVGAGGLGSPALLYLAAAGVGQIGIMDHDRVERSNLGRQVLYTERDIGKRKVDSAKTALQAHNPFNQYTIYPNRFTQDHADLIAQYDVIIDAVDNFASRYLLNDACFKHQKPLVSGSVLRFQGQCSVFHHEGGPCLRCLYPTPPSAAESPNCADAGVLGVLPGILGTVQATEVIKLILGEGETLAGRLLTVDALSMQFKSFEIQKDPACPCCVHGERVNVVDVPEVNYVELQTMKDPYLIDVRETHERETFGDIGGILLPNSQFEVGQVDAPKDAKIVVYCRSGARSAKVVNKLIQAGYHRAMNLRGGYFGIT